MSKLFNLARMTTATTGTGTITLGSAVSGYLTFALAGVANGDTVSYGIKDGADSEIGTGVYTSSGTTLTRSVTKSTNSNAAINLSGTAEVFITPRAEDLADASNLTSGTLDSARLATTETTPVTYTNGNGSSFSHGLGAVPRFIECIMVCQSAASGWSVGDEVRIGGITSGNRGIVTGATSTTVKWVVGSTGIDIMNLSGGTTGAASPSDWKLKFIVRL